MATASRIFAEGLLREQVAVVTGGGTGGPGHGGQRHALAPSRAGGNGPLQRRPGGGRGAHARAGPGMGGRRDRGGGGRRRPLRDRVDTQVPGAGVAGGGANGPAAAPGGRGGGRPGERP